MRLKKKGGKEIEMKLLIEIPTEFESHFNLDRFKDALKRLEFDANYLAGNYEKELAEMLIESFQNAQPVESEIIRCEDCMNHGKEICYFWSHFYGTINTPDYGFCYKAERQED